MKVLVFEDDDPKFARVVEGLEKVGVAKERISRARSLSEFCKPENRAFDLCVIDLWLPMLANGNAIDVAAELLAMIEQADGFRVPVLVITAFAKEADHYRDQFASRGCLIFDYSEPEIWEKALEVYVAQARDRHRYDFLVFTALEEERRAYLLHEGVRTKSVIRSGIDFWDFDWAGKRGAIVLMPRYGLVTASVTVARVLEHYFPRVVCMSGICGGVGGETELGQLLVTELCWEYQSGKWHDQSFSAEPYQVEISEKMRLTFAKCLENTGLIDELEEGFDNGDRPRRPVTPKLGIFASGSAVIASEKRLDAVQQQHRKVSGIDMEIYGFHRAVKLCDDSIVHFSAKAVVDKADKRKDDSLHAYGSFISSKFCLKLIEQLFNSSDRSFTNPA